MNIEKFADMLLKSIEKMEMPAADVQQQFCWICVKIKETAQMKY